MRILWLDEIFPEWKNSITEHGLARYRVFSDDILAHLPIAGISAQRVTQILSQDEAWDFPYSNITIKKPNKNNIAYLNKRNHMGVLVQDEETDDIQFIQWIPKMIPQIDFSDISFDITL